MVTRVGIEENTSRDRPTSLLFANTPVLCFCRCCECNISLTHWYYEKEGRLYCKKDYWARFGELCHGCCEQITKGLIMVRAKHRVGAGQRKCQPQRATAWKLTLAH